jgi:hypothetical protein
VSRRPPRGRSATVAGGWWASSVSSDVAIRLGPGPGWPSCSTAAERQPPVVEPIPTGDHDPASRDRGVWPLHLGGTLKSMYSCCTCTGRTGRAGGGCRSPCRRSISPGMWLVIAGTATAVAGLCMELDAATGKIMPTCSHFVHISSRQADSGSSAAPLACRVLPGQSGGRGIRTHEEREAPNGFQDRRHRPLGEPSRRLDCLTS